MKILVLSLLLIFVFLVSGPLLSPSLRATPSVDEIAKANDIENYVRTHESRIQNLKPGFEKSIVWADPNSKVKTKLSIVYIHGFSASPHDLSPVIERVAAQLQANTFFSRLTAHGLKDGSAFKDVKAQDWVDDAREALAIGRKIGERVVLVGTSTGGLLSLIDAFENTNDKQLVSLVMISPNFGLPDRRVKYISGPLGRFYARMLIGREHSFHADSFLHEQYWTTTYASEGIAALMDLVNGAESLNLAQLKVPTLVLFTSKDTVVDVEAIGKKFAEIGTSDKRIVDLPEANRHEFAGEALAPQATEATVREIVGFVRRH